MGPTSDLARCKICRVVVMVARSLIIQMNDGGVRDVLDLHLHCMKAGGQQCWRELTIFIGKPAGAPKNISADHKAGSVYTAPCSWITPSGLNLGKPFVREARQSKGIAMKDGKIADEIAPGNDPSRHLFEALRFGQTVRLYKNEPWGGCLRSTRIPHGYIVPFWDFDDTIAIVQEMMKSMFSRRALFRRQNEDSISIARQGLLL